MEEKYGEGEEHAKLPQFPNYFKAKLYDYAFKRLEKKIVSKPLNILESENHDQNNNKKCLTAGYAFFKVKRFNLWATAMNRQFLLYINSTI